MSETDAEKWEQLVLLLHDFHNFRESHRRECKYCAALFDFQERILAQQEKE